MERKLYYETVLPVATQYVPLPKEVIAYKTFIEAKNKAMKRRDESCMPANSIFVVYEITTKDEYVEDASCNGHEEDMAYIVKYPIIQVAVWADTSKVMINMPVEVEAILKELKEHGYDSYIVGGCVRDSLLSKTPHDWDICTNAKPEEVMECMSDKYNIVPVGIEHGTVAVIPKGNKEGYEITTYRADGTYTDGRHPDGVTFVEDIKEDLSRRDFTINAMAYNPMDGIVDPYGGILDLLNGMLCCVGSPHERFAEDALRILRALRFASIYELIIETETGKAIHKLAGNLKQISKERITSELLNMFENAKTPGLFLCQYNDVLLTIIPCLEACDGVLQNPSWHQHDILIHSLVSVDSIDMELFERTCSFVGIKDRKAMKNKLAMVRVAALLHDIGKAFAYEFNIDGTKSYPGHEDVSKRIAQAVFNVSLRMTSKMEKDVLALILNHGKKPLHNASLSDAQLLIHSLGKENAAFLIELQKADNIAHGEPLDEDCARTLDAEYKDLDKMLECIQEVVENKMPTDIKDLCINGESLKSLGIQPGPEYARLLEECLCAVIKGTVKNEERDLLAFVKTLL